MLLEALLTLCYDVILASVSAPWILARRFKKQKGPNLSERLGLKIPNSGGRPVIWIHAVSVGETKAARPLFLRLKKIYPDAFFLVTHATQTGHEEAKRSLASADHFAYLPLDLSFVVRRWAKALKPTHFILIEGDFWWNLLNALKNVRCKLTLVSGKISKKSASRFAKIPFFAKRLFGLFDVFCVKSEEESARFAPFRKTIHITGNIKFDLEPMSVISLPLPLQSNLPTLTIASTHPLEEKLLLEALHPLLPRLKIFLAPRHPERFSEVELLLKEKNISFIRWSEKEKATGHETIVLMDCMGQLPVCYAHSLLTLVAGSFIDHIGGHNVLEPCLYGCPSLFGPHAFSQKELTAHVLHAKAGLEIGIKDICVTIEKLMDNPLLLKEMQTAARNLFADGGKATEKTVSLIEGVRDAAP